jgi:hypothetical protein
VRKIINNNNQKLPLKSSEYEQSNRTIKSHFLCFFYLFKELHQAIDYLNKLESPFISSSTNADENSSPLTIPRQVLTECLRLVDKLGIWALLRSSLPIITQLERLSSIAVEQNTISSSSSSSSSSYLSLSSPRAYSLFLDWTCTLLRLWRSRIKTAIETLDSQTLIEQYTTSKLRSLFDIIKRFQSDATSTTNRRWSALLFVDRKQETAVLNAILKDAAKRFADEYSFIRPNFLIGYSTMQPTEDLSTSQHIQPMDSRKQVINFYFNSIENVRVLVFLFRKK